MSYQSRTGAVLFAKDTDRIATFYAAVLGLAEVDRDYDHVLLESPGFQLVVHRIVDDPTASMESGASVRRAAAAFKPVFFVSSIAGVKAAAEAHGGTMKDEWWFNGAKVCDGLDPEGNVIQFRENVSVKARS